MTRDEQRERAIELLRAHEGDWHVNLLGATDRSTDKDARMEHHVIGWSDGKPEERMFKFWSDFYAYVEREKKRTGR